MPCSPPAAPTTLASMAAAGRLRRWFAGAAAVAYSKGVVAAVQLLLVPVLAQRWGLPLYGQWLMLAAVPGFLLASDLGLGVAAGNRVIAHMACGRPIAALETFQSALAAIHCAGLVVLALSVMATCMVPAAVLSVAGGMPASEGRAVLAVLCLYGVVAAHGGLFMAVTRGAGGFARAGFLDATVQLGEGAAALGAVLMGGGPLIVALVWLMVRGLGLGGQVLLARRHVGWLRLGHRYARWRRLRTLRRPALAALVLPLAQAGYLQGTAVAVGATAGASAVPVFTALRTLSRAGLQLVMVVNLPWLPEYTAEHARGNRAWLKRIAARIALGNLAAGAAAGLGLALLGTAVLAAWTHGAIQPPLAMILLAAAGLVLAAVWLPLSNMLVAINRHAGFAAAFLAAACAAIGATAALVPHWGLTGAGAVGLALDGAMLAVVGRQVWRLHHPE